MSVRMSRGKVLPNAQLAVAPSDAYAGSRGLDAEIYTEVPSRVTLETLLSGTVPPTGGLVKIAADAASYSYVIDLSLRVEVRKLFDLNVQKLSFSAQLTVTLEWLVDEGVYEAYAAFWDAYRPQLWLPASSRPGDVMSGASKKTTTRQYAKAHSPAVASQRMRHVSLEVTDTFTFKQPFDLRTFPFDTQALQVVFESPPVEVWGRRFGARLRAPLHEPHVVAAGADLLPSNDICFVYGVGGFPEAPKALAARGERFPERTAAVLIFVERDPTGIVNNVIVPTALFQLLSLVANWIDPCALQFRLGVNLTILLTMAAKQVYVSSLLPRVAFLTPPELAVNWTIFLLFVQSWLKVVSAHLCFPRIRRPFLTVRDFYYEKKIRKTSGADAPWLASSVVDRACEVFTLAVFLGTSLHVLRLYLARRTLRRKLQDARANRDDGFFRRYGERNYDFCNAAQAEVLTEGPKMFLCYTEDDSAGASLNGDDHRVIVFDIGTGEVKALRYAFSPAAGVSVVEIASKREPLSEALREGGAALDAFVEWFSDVLYADVVLDGGGGAYESWAAAGLAWRGPVVASVKPGSLADAAGVRAGWCLWGGPPLDAAGDSAATRASVPMDADLVFPDLAKGACALRFLKEFTVVDVDPRNYSTVAAARGPVVFLGTGSWFRTAQGRALEAAVAFVTRVHAMHPSWRLQKLTDVDECWYELIAVRYAAALHPGVADEPGGVVSVGQGSMQLSLKFDADGPDRLTPWLQPLGNLEGRRTIGALRGGTVRAAVAAWDATVRRRLQLWLDEHGLLDGDGNPRRAVVEPGREVLCIAGCFHAAVAALGLDAGASPSPPFAAGRVVAGFRDRRDAILRDVGDRAAVDERAQQTVITDLSNLTLCARIFDALLDADAPVRFARNWTIQPKPRTAAAPPAAPITFRTTWSAGWFLHELDTRGVEVGVDALKNSTTPFSASDVAGYSRGLYRGDASPKRAPRADARAAEAEAA